MYNLNENCLQSNDISEAVKFFSWYHLPDTELKHYQFFVKHSQRLQVILIGGVRPLNMQFCLSVSFTIITVNSLPGKQRKKAIIAVSLAKT